MSTKTYTILSNGDATYSVQIDYGNDVALTFVHGFKNDSAAETWVRNHKNDEDRLVWA